MDMLDFQLISFKEILTRQNGIKEGIKYRKNNLSKQAITQMNNKIMDRLRSLKNDFDAYILFTRILVSKYMIKAKFTGPASWRTLK